MTIPTVANIGSPTVLSNYSYQFLGGQVGSRFKMYYAVHNPVTITVQSQDIAVDQYGQPSVPASTDLLAGHLPPYAPQPVFGSNRIGFVGEPLLFDGSRSTQRGNLPALNHTWNAPGATATTYNTTYAHGSQISATWAQPGTYVVTLSVRDRFGSTSVGQREVVIYPDRASAPQGAYQLTNVTGSIENGGWTATLTTARKAAPVAPVSTLPPGVFQPITIYVETEYEILPGVWVANTIGQQGGAIPGQSYDDPHIFFSGYIQQGSTTENTQMDTVSYSLATVDMVLKECGIHNIGYYSTNYVNRATNGTPTSLNPNISYKGQLVGDLTSEDIYRSLLFDHTTVGQYHDVVIWREYLTQSTTGGPNGGVQWFWLTYSNLTANEGTIWDACDTLAQNEFGAIWAERNGSINIGPLYPMRGWECMTTPTDYGQFPLGNILDFATELNANVGVADQPAYMVDYFGPSALPQPIDVPGGPARDLSQIVGPPIVADISDVFVASPGVAAPNLYPWITGTWPQDVSLRPIEIDVDINYTSRATFVKEIATLVSANNVWAGYYPVYLPDGTPLFDLTTHLMTQRVNAGTWQVDNSMVLADITAQSQTALSWQYLWEIARRRYFQLNYLYTATINAGMWTWPRLNDLYRVTRQKANDGPSITGIPFYTDSATFQIDLQAQTWTTQLTLNQVTSYNIGPMVPPPYGPPPINAITFPSWQPPVFNFPSFSAGSVVMYTGLKGFPAAGYRFSGNGDSFATPYAGSGASMAVPIPRTLRGQSIGVDLEPTFASGNFASNFPLIGAFYGFFLNLSSLPASGAYTTVMDDCTYFTGADMADNSPNPSPHLLSGFRVLVDAAGRIGLQLYGPIYLPFGGPNPAPVTEWTVNSYIKPGVTSWVLIQMGNGMYVDGVNAIDGIGVAAQTNNLFLILTGLHMYTLLGDQFGNNTPAIGSWITRFCTGTSASTLDMSASVISAIWPLNPSIVPFSEAMLPKPPTNNQGVQQVIYTGNGPQATSVAQNASTIGNTLFGSLGRTIQPVYMLPNFDTGYTIPDNRIDPPFYGPDTVVVGTPVNHGDTPMYLLNNTLIGTASALPVWGAVVQGGPF